MRTVDNLYMFYNLMPKKAFDRVSYSRLFNVLLDNSVCPYIVRLLGDIVLKSELLCEME